MVPLPLNLVVDRCRTVDNLLQSESSVSSTEVGEPAFNAA